MFLRSSIQAGCGMWDASWVKRDVVLGDVMMRGGCLKSIQTPPNDPIPKIEPFLIVHRKKIGGLTFMIKTHHFFWPQV